MGGRGPGKKKARVKAFVEKWLEMSISGAYGLLFYSDFKQIRAFVAKRDMLRIRAFLNFFDSDLTQTNAI